MDKHSINNQIVSLRGKAKKSKCQTINKLVRTVRKLRVKKGSENQVKKYLSKADRLTSEIIIIKKLCPDEVIKYAIINLDKGKPEVSDEKNKALHRLYLHKDVRAAVMEFNEKNKDKMARLPHLFNLWDIQRNNLKKKKKDKKTTEKSKQTPKREKSKSKTSGGKKETIGSNEIKNFKNNFSESEESVDSESDLSSKVPLKNKSKKVDKKLKQETEKVNNKDAKNLKNNLEPDIKNVHSESDGSESDVSSEEPAQNKSKKVTKMLKQRTEEVNHMDNESKSMKNNLESDEGDSESDGSESDLNLEESLLNKSKKINKILKENDVDSESEDDGSECDLSTEEHLRQIQSGSDDDDDNNERDDCYIPDRSSTIETNSAKSGSNSESANEELIILNEKKNRNAKVKRNKKNSSKENKTDVISNSTMEIRRIDLKDLSDDEEVSVPNFISEVGYKPSSNEEKKKSSFFINSDDDLDQAASEEDTKDNSSTFTGNRKQRRQQAFGITDQYFHRNTARGRSRLENSGQKSRGTNLRGRGRGSRGRGLNRGRPYQSQGWKKKDDGSDANFIQPEKSSNFKTFENSSNSRTFEKNSRPSSIVKEIPSEKLHPSWEAKRKQKEMLTKIPQFQGKKIKFE